MQDIRHLMLEQLAAVQDASEREHLEHRIGTAPHPQDLWALRDELRAVLVRIHGERLAHQRMTDISFMFAGLLHGRSRSADVALPGWAGGACSLGQDGRPMRADH